MSTIALSNGFKQDIDSLNRHDLEQLAMYFSNSNILWYELTLAFSDFIHSSNQRFTGDFWKRPIENGNTCPTVFEADSWQFGVDNKLNFVAESGGQYNAPAYILVSDASDATLKEFLEFEYQQYQQIQSHMKAIQHSMNVFSTALEQGISETSVDFV